MPYNPYAGWAITGTWEEHLTYSLGGTDYGLSYGTALPAPAAGTLHTSGYPLPPSEFQCGWVGSAGRRQILMLDSPVGDVVAVVFQHLSQFGVDNRHYAEAESTGLSGASADGIDYGGDTHLHIHCLTADGTRRRFEDYFTATTPTPGGTMSWDAIDDGTDRKGNDYRLGFVLGNLGRKIIYGLDGALVYALRGTVLKFTSQNVNPALRPGGANNVNGTAGFSAEIALTHTNERVERIATRVESTTDGLPKLIADIAAIKTKVGA